MDSGFHCRSEREDGRLDRPSLQFGRVLSRPESFRRYMFDSVTRGAKGRVPRPRGQPCRAAERFPTSLGPRRTQPVSRLLISLSSSARAASHDLPDYKGTQWQRLKLALQLAPFGARKRPMHFPKLTVGHKSDSKVEFYLCTTWPPGRSSCRQQGWAAESATCRSASSNWELS